MKWNRERWMPMLLCSPLARPKKFQQQKMPRSRNAKYTEIPFLGLSLLKSVENSDEFFSHGRCYCSLKEVYGFQYIKLFRLPSLVTEREWRFRKFYFKLANESKYGARVHFVFMYACSRSRSIIFRSLFPCLFRLSATSESDANSPFE